jgi:hypothetical protein
MMPMHMNVEAWEESLDAFRGATEFERDLDRLMLKLHSSTTRPQQAIARVKKYHYPQRNWLTGSPPNNCVWRQRLDDWIQQTVSDTDSVENDNEQGCVEDVNTVLQPQIDLMEALFAHGIIRENDLRLLPPIASATEHPSLELNMLRATTGSYLDSPSHSMEPSLAYSQAFYTSLSDSDNSRQTSEGNEPSTPSEASFGRAARGDILANEQWQKRRLHMTAETPLEPQVIEQDVCVEFQGLDFESRVSL